MRVAISDDLIHKVVRDFYPIPHSHDFEVELRDMNIFTRFDLIKAHYQTSIEENDIQKSAITTHFHLFEFTRLSLGLETWLRLLKG